MREFGLSEAQVKERLASLEAAIAAMPGEMDGYMLTFFVTHLLDTYGIEGMNRVGFILSLCEASDLEVIHLTEPQGEGSRLH
jgi:hypothetical protein